MIEGRPRESLVLFDNPIEVSQGMDVNAMTNPHRKSFGSKSIMHQTNKTWFKTSEVFKCIIWNLVLVSLNNCFDFSNVYHF